MAQWSNYAPGGHPCNRKIGAMNSVIRECALLLMAVIGWTELALARSYLNCLAKKVVIVDTPRGSTSSSVEEHLRFWIDEAAKTVVLADGTPLTSVGLMTTGLALLAATCPMSWIAKMAI
jgi:hypothetical protein